MKSLPARVVVDADMLAAGLLVDGPARATLDRLRRYSWTTLVASDSLLDGVKAVISSLADAGLMVDWRGKAGSWAELVAYSDGDNPALVLTYRDGAVHLLALDDRLSSAQAGAALGGRFPVSVRRPKAFASLFAPESLCAEVESGPYPGPDHDPRV